MELKRDLTKPISIIWEMESPMLTFLLKKSNKVVDVNNNYLSRRI